MTAMQESSLSVYPRFSNTNEENPYNLNVVYNEFDKNKETIVLLHGYLGSIKDYHAVIEDLEGDYNLIAIDLRGHGGSDTPANASWTIRDFSNDIFQVLDKILPSKTSVTLVASSMSTAIALELANEFPGRIEKLYLISATTKFTVPGWIKFLLGLGKMTPTRITNMIVSSACSMFTMGMSDEEKTIIEEGIDKFKELGMKIHRKIIYEALSTWEANIENITQPVFIIAGIDDKIVPYKDSRELAENLPRTTLLSLEDSEHHLLLNREKIVVDTLRQWLEETELLNQSQYLTNNDLDNFKGSHKILTTPYEVINSHSQNIKVD